MQKKKIRSIIHRELYIAQPNQKFNIRFTNQKVNLLPLEKSWVQKKKKSATVYIVYICLFHTFFRAPSLNSFGCILCVVTFANFEHLQICSRLEVTGHQADLWPGLGVQRSMGRDFYRGKSHGKNPGWFYQWLMVEVVARKRACKIIWENETTKGSCKENVMNSVWKVFAKAKTMERRAGLLGCSPILGMMKIISWDAHPGFRVITRIDVIQSWWFRNPKKHQESLDVKKKTTSIYIYR